MREGGLKAQLGPGSSLLPQPKAQPSLQYLCVDLLIDRTLRFLLFLHSQQVYQGPNGHALEGRRVSDILALPPGKKAEEPPFFLRASEARRTSPLRSSIPQDWGLITLYLSV